MIDKNARLGAMLKREALASRPEHDEKLHARILEAVDPWRHPVDSYAAAPRSRLAAAGHSAWLPLGLAASLIIAFGAYAWSGRMAAPPAAGPQLERIAGASAVDMLEPATWDVETAAVVHVDDLPTTQTPSLMVTALTEPLQGFTARTSRIPVVAAHRLGRLQEANSAFAETLVRDQLATLDRDARSAAHRLWESFSLSDQLGPAAIEVPLAPAQSP